MTLLISNAKTEQNKTFDLMTFHYTYLHNFLLMCLVFPFFESLTLGFFLLICLFMIWSHLSIFLPSPPFQPLWPPWHFSNTPSTCLPQGSHFLLSDWEALLFPAWLDPLGLRLHVTLSEKHSLDILYNTLYSTDSEYGPRTPASAPSGNLLKIQILKPPHLRPTGSETLG